MNELYDLFIDLDATEDAAEFPDHLYQCAEPASRKTSLEDTSRTTLQPLFEAIVKHIPHPPGDRGRILQILVANLDYSDYLGRLAIGRVFNGTLRLGDEVAIVKLDGSMQKTKITKLYSFEGLEASGRNDRQAGRHSGHCRRGRHQHWRNHHQRGNSEAAAAYPDRRADDRDDVHDQHVAVRGTRRTLT